MKLDGSITGAGRQPIEQLRVVRAGLRAQFPEHLASQLKIHGTAIVGIHKIETPQLISLIKVGHARRRHFQQRLRNGVPHAGSCDGSLKLAKVFKGHADKLVSVYFDVDDEEREGPEDAYPLGISLVYNVERDRGKDAATSAAGEIKKIFQNEFCATGKWLNIELTYCDPVAETAFSIRAHRYFKKWHLDHLSLRNDDPVVVTSA